jgi:hypothetical protein
MKRLTVLLSFSGLLMMGTCATSQAAQITCDLGDYNGTYAFITEGSFVQLPPAAAALAGTFAQAGVFISDGLGHVTIQSNASYNGILLPANVPGTYTVAPDCTTVFQVTLPPPLSIPSTFTGVLSNDNRSMALTITNPPGTVVIGTHAKQDIRFCGNSTFHGSYAIDMGGALAGASPQAGPFRRVGRLVADGAGKFTATSMANYAGGPVEEDFDGTYSVAADCAVSFSYQVPGTANTLTWGGYLAGHGDIAMIMITNSGWAVSGTLKAQQP